MAATKLGNMNKPNVTYSHNYQKSFFLSQVTLDELMGILQHLTNKWSVGEEDISNIVLKELA